jgi:hypothetical protein
MKAYYVENNGYDAIIILERSHFWVNPSANYVQLFASENPNFPDWQDSPENVESNSLSVWKHWGMFDDSILIAENSDGGQLTIHNQHAWNRRIEEMNVSLPQGCLRCGRSLSNQNKTGYCVQHTEFAPHRRQRKPSHLRCPN